MEFIKKCAIIVPTYNRDTIINEFIEKYVGNYTNDLYDIYILDSSTNELTKSIVDNCQYCNINYIRVDSNIHANLKILDGYKLILSRKYEYAWIMGDAIRIDKCDIDLISDCLNEKNDFIHIINGQNNEISRYSDPVSFFNDYAWHVTMFGSLIVNVSSVLSKVDWDSIISSFAIDNCICYSHVAMCFVQMERMKELNILNIAGVNIFYSSLRKNSMWYTDTFDVYCNDWLNTIHKLPSVYDDYKLKVIKDLPHKSIIRNRYDLLKMRSDGVLNHDIYNKYKCELEELLVWNTDDICKLVDYHGTINDYIIDRCKNIISRNGIDSLWLYGTGKYSHILQEILYKCNVKIDGFVESIVKINETNGIPVVSIEEYSVKYAENSVIAVAVGKMNRPSVIDSLLKNKICDYFQDDEIDAYICGLMRDGMESLTNVIE